MPGRVPGGVKQHCKFSGQEELDSSQGRAYQGTSHGRQGERDILAVAVPDSTGVEEGVAEMSDVG